MPFVILYVGSGMWGGEFLSAWGEVKLVICAPKYAAGVVVYLDVYVLRVVGTANVDEGAELDSDGSFKCGEPGVCVFIVHGDDVKVLMVVELRFLCGMMYGPSGAGLRCMGDVAKF